MMEYIAHRVNTLEELSKIPFEYGVELDLRDFGNDIIISHDPFVKGELFEDYLRNYQHGTMILNIKSERIEHEVLKLVKKYNIKNYFFLDSSFPMIHLLSSLGEDNIAIRLSEYEGMDTLIKMQGKVKWVWVDCFTKLPIDNQDYTKLKEMGYKLCLVSPELQNQAEKITEYKMYLENEGISFDAICTKIKNIDLWKSNIVCD